ncbi:MAG: Holliday junction resolvase RuvX, partial [Candidatus Saccharimonadales bacterium]
MQQQSSILGLDIGSVRVGVARASWPDGIPTKLTVLANGPDLVDKLTELVRSENVSLLVAGLPRSLDGNETSQTRQTTQQVELLKQELKLP